MFRDLYQSYRITQNTNDIINLQHKVGQNSRTSENTSSQVDTLRIINQALYELISEKLGITEQEVMSKLEEIDARDGRIDGKITPRPMDCPKCSRKTNTRRDTCMYCGEKYNKGTVF